MAGEDDDRRDHGEGFLSRWSRRKREVPDAPPSADPPPAAPAVAEDDARPRDPETGEPIDEELVASLPRLDEIRPGADLSAFMRRGVPEAMRRQALRLMWETDPVIRDFVSPALDYAYDYNAPGGAPGYGPLTESDIAQAKDFINRLLSDSDLRNEKRENAQSEASGDNESQNDAAAALASVRRADAAPQQTHESAVTAESSDDAVSSDKTASDQHSGIVRRGNDAPGAAPETPASPPAPAPQRRRGGGAAPV
jgi:hypothetical protein